MRSYLDGGVKVEVLGGDSAAGLFRAGDARGGVAWLTRGEPFHYLHVVEFRNPGDRRGFHVHQGHDERLYIFSGSLRLIAEHNGETIDVVLDAGALITFVPGVTHGFIAESATIAVSFGSGTDPMVDTTPRPELGG
ncbi:cupin domain-containing protein [Longimicrobium sp.]|uniref:cupin domain-containing protein n=1 Tax=Longimicrobium sp. TaxID=2029185 RepID=UPI003B3A03C3